MKKIIEEVIFVLVGDDPIRVSVLKTHNIELQDNDVIISGYVEPFVSRNESCDGHYQFQIIRDREETDEEYNKRLEKEAKTKKEFKDLRYKSYLKLKKEFEDNEP